MTEWNAFCAAHHARQRSRHFRMVVSSAHIELCKGGVFAVEAQSVNDVVFKSIAFWVVCTRRNEIKQAET